MTMVDAIGRDEADAWRARWIEMRARYENECARSLRWRTRARTALVRARDALAVCSSLIPESPETPETARARLRVEAALEEVLDVLREEETPR